MALEAAKVGQKIKAINYNCQFIYTVERVTKNFVVVSLPKSDSLYKFKKDTGRLVSCDIYNPVTGYLIEE